MVRMVHDKSPAPGREEISLTGQSNGGKDCREGTQAGHSRLRPEDIIRDFLA